MGQGQSQNGTDGGGSAGDGPPTAIVFAKKPQNNKQLNYHHDGSNKCSPARVKSCLRTFFAHLFSHIGLCILIVGYTIAGALMFERLEKSYEMKLIGNRTANFRKLRLHYVNELWNITEQFNVLYEMNWTSAVEKELREFETKVVATANSYSDNVKDDLHWTFSGALLYSVSIITTIGYGNTAPRTPWGKILTMLYAVCGIPLMLLWLSNIGTLMANTFKFAYSHACCTSSPSSISSSSRSVQTKRQPSSKTEPSSIQVKYSVSAMTCETLVVQQQQQQQKALNRREQRAALRSLDPAAKQVLMECAEYNVNMDQDERSRRILHQLHSDPSGSELPMSLNGNEEESSDEVESVIDMRGVTGGGVRGLNGGGSVVGISSNTNGMMDGTPSRVPLLSQGKEIGGNGPDLVEVEDYGGGSDRSHSPSLQFHPPKPVQQRVPVSLVLTFVVLYIMGGAAVFSAWEEWGFLDSAYFCFITLSTIGLGDYVPGASLGSAGTKEGQAQLIACCLYLVLGLAIIAMSFNLVQEEVAAKVKDIARHIGIINDNEDH